MNHWLLRLVDWTIISVNSSYKSQAIGRTKSVSIVATDHWIHDTMIVICATQFILVGRPNHKQLAEKKSYLHYVVAPSKDKTGRTRRSDTRQRQRRARTSLSLSLSRFPPHTAFSVFLEKRLLLLRSRNGATQCSF